MENAASSAASIIIIELFEHEEATTEFTAVKSLFLLLKQQFLIISSFKFINIMIEKN